ncbi:beta/gamma crystallin domain-containing protein 1 [Sardina pilchardus]|uniref:beta/gamma crystallin domain-containing protein 1 n=1 Tax=Sardina pilchardus TaxID=27697 RepID=UPI002E14CA02
MEASTDICNVDNTLVGIQDAVTGQKAVLADGAIADAAQQSKTELASLTDLIAIECHVPSIPRNSFVGEKISHVANPLMSDKGEGVDGDQNVVITDIPQCLNMEPDIVCSEPAAVDAPRVVPQSFDENQHRQTEDAFSGVMDKRIEVRSGEATMVSQVEVSKSIVPVQQRGVDPKEIPEEMCNNNCSMDRESHTQQGVVSQTIGEMKQEEVEAGRPVHSSLVLPWEPATPVGQVCEAPECDPAPPSQELAKERVWGASLNSCCLATFPDSGTKPLPQARGKITENECSVGAESTNNLPETHPSPAHLTSRAADAGQTPPAHTRLPDAEKQTHRHMEAETHMQQAGAQETPTAAASSADTLPSTGTIGQGNPEQPTQWQSEPPSTTLRHAAITTEATRVALLTTDPGPEAAVPCMEEPGSRAFSDGLASATPSHLTGTGLPKQHRPVIIVQRAAGPAEYQTSADATDVSTMEVSKATFSFSSLSTPETKHSSTSQVPSSYSFSSSSIPEGDGKQCHKVSIAGIPEAEERTVRYFEPSSPTMPDHQASDRWKARYGYQYRPNAGTRAFPLAGTLDYHHQGDSSSIYSPYSSSTVTDFHSPYSSSTVAALPLEPARYTPHRFASEGREQPEKQPTSPALPSSPGNQRSWLSDSAEAQPSEPGGRSWAGPASTPAGESGAEGARESESVLERRGERAFYSGSDVPLFTDHTTTTTTTYTNSNSSSSSSVGPASPTVQPDDYSGVFKATRVEIIPSSSPTSSSFSSSSPPSLSSSGGASSTALSTSPVSPQEPVSPHLETLKDTLKDTVRTMEKTSRVRTSRLSGAPSLPPIKEDIPDSPAKEPAAAPANRHAADSSMLFASSMNGNVAVSLPANLGLNWNTTKDMRSPLTLMKLQQQQVGLGLPLRASTASSIVMRGSSFGEDDASQVHQLNQLNGNAGLMSPSRLDNSLIFSTCYQPQQQAYQPQQQSYQSQQQQAYQSQQQQAFQAQQQAFQSMENGLHAQRSLFRTGSLPETGSMGGHERISSAPLGLGGLQANHNLNASSRIERLSFLASPAGSAVLDGYADRMSMPSQQLNPMADMSIGLGQASQQVNPLDSRHHLQRSYSTDSALGSSLGSPLFNDISNGRGQQAHQPEPEPPKQPAPKYRAFPDAYLTKEKEHGKLNPRPGKLIIFDKPGMKGQRIEVRGDVVDATEWEFPESISIRIIRGGWVLYEKPSFKGEKIALDEGDIETLTNPFDTPDEAHKQNGQTQTENGEANQNPEPKKFVIGSIRRAVRDYSVPEISLFPEENAEGKKVVFRDTSEDARIFGFAIKANSIIINAGLWLVYAEPFFQGIPRVLEVGGFTNPAAWGVTQPYVGSLHPLKIGEPRVEKPNEPKLVLYDKPYFTGRSRELYSSMRDFMTRIDRQQTAFMYNAGSIKVTGGCWVGYEKEGFRGKQYLLEEGEYQDWRVWGGCDAELRSVRVIRADLTDPALVMYELPDEQLEEPQEERTFEVTEAIPDVELFGFRTTTRSIQVLAGAWVAYSHVDFSGNQYILEKGFYNNCADWGSADNRICSLQPILMAPSDGPGYRNEVMLYSDVDFQGNSKLCSKNEETLPDSFIAKSCRVVGSSWAVYEGRNYTGQLYTVSEGDYPNLNSMGCPPHCIIRSVKAVPVMFAVPSISLFGLECFEGREITVDTEVLNLLEEGFNNHVLSVKVNNGCWVVCEHSNYRGRQFLLEPIEVTSWQKFSELTSIGSMYPIREKRRYFRVKNKERGHYLSIQGAGEDMKTGRVVVMEEVEPMTDVWYYHDGLIKNKLSPTTSLQVMGSVEPGAKVVLWNETRTPIQIWSISLNGTIVSTTFPGMVLDIKCGKAYDRDHVVIREESDEQPCQHWELELL